MCRNFQRCIASRCFAGCTVGAADRNHMPRAGLALINPLYGPERDMIFIIYYSSIVGPVHALVGPKSLVCQYETTEDVKKPRPRHLYTPPSQKKKDGTECLVCHFPCAVVQFITEACPRLRAAPCTVIPANRWTKRQDNHPV